MQNHVWENTASLLNVTSEKSGVLVWVLQGKLCTRKFKCSSVPSCFSYLYMDWMVWEKKRLGARCGCRRPRVSPFLLTMLCNALTSLPHKTVSIQYEISVFSLHLQMSLYQWLHFSDNCSLLNILMLIFNFLLKGKEQSAARYIAFICICKDWHFRRITLDNILPVGFLKLYF